MRGTGEWKPKARRVRRRSLLLADSTRALLRPLTSAALMGAPDRVVGRVGGTVQRRGCDILQEVGPDSLPSRLS